MRYYRPKAAELEEGLELEMFYAPENSWSKFTYKEDVHKNIPLEDLRIKYLDTDDFNSLGIGVKKVFLGTQTQIKDFDEKGDEITEEVDVFSEEVMMLWSKGKDSGFFYPFKPQLNVKMFDKEHTIKNRFELKRLIDGNK